MRLSFWIVSRNLGSRRLATTLAILGIAFGVAAVWAVQVVDLNTVLGVRAHFRRDTGNPDLELRAKDARTLTPEAAAARLKGDHRIDAVTPLVTERVVLVRGNQPPVDLLGIAIDPGAANRFDPYLVVDGRDIRRGERGVVLLGGRAASEAKVRLGDKIALQRPPMTHEGCVDGATVVLPDSAQSPTLPVTFEVVGILADLYLARPNRGRSVVLPFDDVSSLAPAERLPVRWWIRLLHDDESKLVTASLANDFVVTVPQAREVGETPEERAFRSGVRIASFVALGVGLFIIYHLLSLTVTSWVRQAGLLGALGVTGGQLGGIFFLEALVLAVLGTATGIGIGTGIARWMLDARLTTLGWGRPVSTFEIPWRDVWWVGCAGVAACLLGAVQPLFRIRRVQVVDALTQGESALAAVPAGRWLAPVVLALGPAAVLTISWYLRWVDEGVLGVSLGLASVFGAFVLVLWGMPRGIARGLGVLLKPFERGNRLEPWLVRKGLDRGLRRFAGSVTGLALVAAGLVTLHAMTGALKREKDEWGATALSGRVFLRLKDVPRPMLSGLTAVPGVRSVVPVDATVRVAFDVKGVAPEELAKDGVLAGPLHDADRVEFALGRGMVVTSVCAREHQLVVGDDVMLPAARGPRHFKLLAVDDRAGFFPHERAFGVISEAAMKQVFCRSNDVVTQLALSVDPPEREADVVERIASGSVIPKERIDRIWSGAHQRKLYEDEINSDFRIFDVILGLTAVLAALGMLNTLVVSGLERQKEIALLRAAGITRRQVFRLFLSDALMLGLCGGVFGGLMAMPFAWFIVDGLARISHMPLRASVDPLVAIVGLLGVALLAVVAAVAPAMRAGRADVVSGLKFE